MGNKLGCNCGPIGRKPYHRGYDDSQWSAQSSSRSFGKRDGHLLRLWAEVFHVTTAGGGTVKWQQVSEDLVPVNITCIQDSPEVVFHITAYNSQVDKILDVRLVQPGTRIGQASECFVYWKDPVTSDTWGLNFTSPIDAKQFRECCSPAFKFSRKASSSYSLKDNNTRAPVGRSGTLSGTASRGGSGRINTSASTGRRRPLSTPTSPSKSREPQCTCMTAEQYARLRAMDPRFRAASTLPRATPTQQPRPEGSGGGKERGPPTDNYATVRRGTETKGIGTVSDMEGEEGRAERLGRGDRERGPGDGARGRGPGRGGRDIVASKSVDYSDNELATRETIDRKKSRSKSTDDVTERNAQAGTGTGRRTATQQQQTEAQATQTAYTRSRTQSGKSTIGTNTTPTGDGLTDSVTLKRLLKPISTTGSVATSPEMSRRVYHHDGYISEPEIRHTSSHTQPGKRATDTLRRVHERSRGVGTQTQCYGKFKSESSPPSDQPVFDHAYYATTPPSSSPEGEGQGSPSPGSPSARLLLEYEQHLRNTLAKGMDAESYSLHTFEAIISQSNENLSVPPNSRSTTLPRLAAPSRENFRISHEASREASRDSDVLSGYYSDFRDRGYLSDHNSRSSGYYDRHENSKSGYFSDRENRSGYYSDREVHSHQKYGSVRPQASVESADSRLCYLTSSEGKQARPALNIITTTNKKESREPPSSASNTGGSSSSTPHRPPPPPPPPPLPPPPAEPPEITVIPTSSPETTKRTDEHKTAPSLLPTASTSKAFVVASSSTPSSPVCSGESSKSSLLTPTRAKPKLFPKPVLSPRPTPKKLSIPPPRAQSGGSADSSLSLSPAASDCSTSETRFTQSPVTGKASPEPSELLSSPKASPVSSTPPRVTFAPIATVVESSPVRTPSPPPRDYDIPTVEKPSPEQDDDDEDEERNNDEDDDERAWSPAKVPRREEVCQNTGRFTVRILPSPSHVRFISQPQPHHVVLRSPRKEAGVATVIPADAPVGAEDLAYYPTTVRTLPNPRRQKFGSGEKAHVRFASEDELYPPRDYSPEECKKTESLSPTRSPKDEEKKVKVKVEKDETEERELLLPKPKPKSIKQEVVAKPKVQTSSASTSSVLALSSPSSTSTPSVPVSSSSSSFVQSSNTIVIELSRSESKNSSSEQNVVQIQLSPVKSSVPSAAPIQSTNTIQIGLSHREPSQASPAKSVSSALSGGGSRGEEREPDLGETTESPEAGGPRKRGQRGDISEGLFWKTAEREREPGVREEEDADKSPVQIHYNPAQAKTVITFSPSQADEDESGDGLNHPNPTVLVGVEDDYDDEDDEEEDESDEDAWADESPEPEREEDSVSIPLTLSSSTSATTAASRNKGELSRRGRDLLGTTQPVTTSSSASAIVAQVISGFYPLPSVPSPATASPSSASQSSSSTTGPTTVVIPTPPTPVTSHHSGGVLGALLIPSTSVQSHRAESELAPLSTAAAAAIYATCSKTLPARSSTASTGAGAAARHSHLSHYNSIQELYSFVSEVLSSQAESHGASATSTAVVTASGGSAAYPQYTLCKYHLKQKQQRQKLQQKLIVQQQLLQHHQQTQSQPPQLTQSSSHHHPQSSSGGGHPHQHHHQPQQHHPHRGPPPQSQSQTLPQSQSQTHLHQQSSTSRKSQQAVVAQRQQNGQEGSGLQQQQPHHYHHYQQPQQTQQTQAQQHQQHYQQISQQQQQQQPSQQHQYQPQPGVVAARSLTLAHNVSQRQRHHPQTSINQNIYRPVLPGLGDPNTLPRKGAPLTSSLSGGKGSSATLPSHSHQHQHHPSYYQQQQHSHPAVSSSAGGSVAVATSSGSGVLHHHPQHSHHHQVSTSGGGSGAGDHNIVKSSAGGSNSGGGGSVGMVTTAGRAQSAGPTSTSAFYSTLTPIRQPAQQQSSLSSQPHAFQPVPQRHHHQQQQQNAQVHQQHIHHQQQQHALHQQQYRTPSHQVGCSSSSTNNSKHPIQRSVSVAAASTSTTNYSAVQALAASKQYSGAPIVASSSSGVFQPLASAPSLLTAVTSSQNHPVSISSSYDYATIQHVQQQRHQLHHQQQLAAAAAAAKDQIQKQQQQNQPIYATHTALQHQISQQSQQVSQSQQIQTSQQSALSQSSQQLAQHHHPHAAHAHHLHHQYYYNTLEHPAYANYYQPAESLTGHEEPMSRPVSNLSNKSSEHFYTYPYPRKQQDQIFKPIDWCTLVHWARKAVQSREDDNEIKCECSHGCHEIKGLKRHEHQHSWPHVQPHECNVLFLAKVMQRISDDERMSLTTAVSDDEPGDGANSPKGSRKPAASFNCTGAVRKAGFLSVKKWLLRKRHQVELARRRGWKGYWVCLKGTTLLFYPCDARETSRSVEAAPKHLIIVDGAIMQPIPEHPKRDYIFCLSTAFGDAYLFQAPCQVELESWVHSIHWACAAAFARHRGKTGTLHLLQEEIIRLDKAIESDGKLRHMAELQRSVVADPETRQQLAQQIATWEENIERLHCEQFRLRCYMASLQGGELPNPKSLLSHVSRTTKNTLNRLGVFTVSSFHAYVCARSPSLLSNLLAGRGATKRRAPLLSRSNSASSRRSLHVSSSERENERTAKISLPDNQVVTVPLKDAMSVEEFLVSACARKGLAPMEHFVRVKKRRELPDTNYFVPHRSDLIDTYLSTHEVVEVRAKLLYQVELSRSSLDQMWGFSVEAELVENADRQDELCCYVSRVEERSVAMSNGIIKGDEILVINGAIVSDLDMMYIESVLQEELSLCLMLRSSRTEPPALAAALAAADAAIAQLVCPPPPADPLVLTEDILSHLIVPAPHENKDLSPSDTEEMGGHASGGEQGGRASRTDSTEIESLLKTAEQVTGICRTKEQRAGRGGHHHPLTHQKSSAGSLGAESPVQVVSGGSSPTHSQLTMGARDVEKTKKVVLELIDTERAYVKHLTCLLEQYLEPLRHERFLSATEMMAIFGNIREMVSVQRRFLKSLEAALESSTPIESITHPSDFKNILLNIASAFLSFADHFKLYSSFCASHSKAQKLLHPTEGNQALQQFLASRNPRQQHSNTLESYLIKPIQRILKYPLLLQQLRNLCDTNTEEYRNLVEALQCMERVAEHINEMQRIHEEYGAIFEHLFRQHQKLCKTQIDLSPGDLLHYGGVEWLNIADFLGKIKKGLELHAMCFVFRTAVVFLCKERLRHKKKLMGSTSKVSDKSEVEIIRYQVLIPVSEVQVRQIGDPKVPEVDTLGSNYSWELVHLRNQAARRSEKVYLLSNSTAEFRNAFLRNIRQIIRESVRNMSLPPRLSDMTGADGEPIMMSEDGGGHPGEGSSSHYATPEGSDLAERAASSSNTSAHHNRAHQAQTLGRKKPPKPPQRHNTSAGNLEMGAAGRLRHQESSDSSSGFRSRSKTMSDAAAAEGRRDGTDSEEGREGGISSGSVTMPRVKGMLGNTPIHLTLSTTSTLSAGSTGSAAKLIQASSTPGRSIPPHQPLPEPSSPIWKPREAGFDSQTLPRPKSDHSAEPQPSTSAAAKTPPSTKAETLPRHPR